MTHLFSGAERSEEQRQTRVFREAVASALSAASGRMEKPSFYAALDAIVTVEACLLAQIQDPLIMELTQAYLSGRRPEALKQALELTDSVRAAAAAPDRAEVIREMMRHSGWSREEADNALGDDTAGDCPTDPGAAALDALAAVAAEGQGDGE